MQLLFKIFLLLITVLPASTFAKDYVSDRTGIHFTAPPNWIINKQKSVRHVDVVHKNDIATINVSIHYFSDPITANGLQRFRVASKYDGWINLFERPGTSFESQRANMDDSHIAVYTKKLLDNTLTVRTKLNAEYYFTQGKVGAIISIDTFKEDWGSIQLDVKQLLESFWIGKGERPPIAPPDQASLGWEMIGKSAGNQFYSEKFSIPPTPNLSWTVFLDKPDLESPALHPNNITTTDKYMVVYDNASITCFSLQSGKKIWTYPSSRIDHHLVLNETTLYFLNGEEKKKLIALSLDTGNLLFKRPIEHDIVSELIYSQQKLILYTPSDLLAIHPVSGDLIWSSTGNFDPSYYPIANSKLVIVAENQKKLLAFEHENGALSWVRELDHPLLISPAMDDTNLFVSIGKKESFRIHEKPTGIIQCLDLKQAGKKLWAFEGLDIANEIVGPLSLGNGRLGAKYRIQDGSIFENDIYFPVPNLDLLVCLDKNTGEKLWVKQAFSDIGSPAFSVFSSRTDMFINTLFKGEASLQSIRSHSGTPYLMFSPQPHILEGFLYSFSFPISPSKLLLVGYSESQSSIQLVSQTISE